MATYTSNYGWTKPSGSDNVDISVLNNNLDDQDSTIHDAFLNMAPPFSESSTYAVDDIVLYGTGLYKCHTAVVTPGSWTGSTNWQVYKLSEGGSGGGGTSNYNDLTNKPSINSVELSGNKTAGDFGLQSELTFDNTPTDGSNNPVKSDGIYDSEKDIYAVMGKMGAKNFIQYPYYETTKTVNGVTFTDNGDGTVSVTGRAEGGDATFVLHTRNQGEIYDFTIPNGNYILSGCPSGGTSSSFYLNIGCTKNGAWSSLGVDFGNGENITCDGDDYSQTSVNPAINIVVKSGYSITGTLTFKPMLRLASDTDYTYQPYAKTNRELTDEIATKTKNFQGTIAEWNQLTTAEKKAYDHASIPDSLDGNVTFPASKVMLNSGDSVEERIEDKATVTLSATGSTLEATVKNGILFICFSITPSTANTWVYPFSDALPAGYRPNRSIYVSAITTADVKVANVFINNDGTIQIKGASTGTFTGCASYYI